MVVLLLPRKTKRVIRTMLTAMLVILLVFQKYDKVFLDFLPEEEKKMIS